MSRAVYFALAFLVAAPLFAADLSGGDAGWTARAEGAPGAVASSTPIDAAIAAFRAAAQAAPDDLEATGKLLRALYFRGVYCGADKDARKTIFAEAKALGDRTIARLEAATKGSDRIAALKSRPGAAAVYFWTAAAWGEWALAYGKLAAAKEGAAATIRDLAQTVIELDPLLENGGGHRVLGRLHDQSPKIPFITGWVDRKLSLSELRAALAIAPNDKGNQLFLAEAILEHDDANAAEARALLERCRSEPPLPEMLIEHRHYAALCATRLAQK